MYMKDVTVSFRVNERIHGMMKIHDEINWSAVVRAAVAMKLAEMHTIDKERARKASREIDEIRKSGVFDGGKNSTEIIREWRDKRK
jgi:hypothetical protein